MVQKTDEELMELYSREASQDAFNELYRRYAPRLYGYLKAKGLSHAERETVFQDTFLKLHRSRNRYAREFPVAPWLFTICRNALIDHWRVQGKAPVSSEISPDDLAAPTRQETVTSVDSAALLSHLPQLQRRAVEDRYLHDMPFEAIAKRLQKTEVNVRQMISRGLRRLRNAAKKGGQTHE